MADDVIGQDSAAAYAPVSLRSLLADARLLTGAALALTFAAFAYYVYLIDANPTIYWYDALHRYAFPGDLTVDRWLPGSQIVVYVGRQLSSDPLATRLLLAAVSSFCLLAIWGLTRRISTPVAGLIAVSAICTSFVFASLATVPYGEMLFMGCALSALLLLDKPRNNTEYYLGAALLVGACMTRYEAWFLAGILVCEQVYFFYRGERDKRVFLFCLIVAMPIVLWLVLGTSYTRPGESSIHERLNLEHAREFLTGYGRLLRWQEVDPWIALAPVGFVLAWLKGTHRAMHLKALAFAGLTFVMIALVEPYAGVNFRSTFVTFVFVHIYAAIGLVMLTEMAVAKLSVRLTQPRLSMLLGALMSLAVVVVLLVYHTPRANDFVERASREPHFYGAQIAGRWLRDQPRDGATIYGLTDDILQRFSIAGMSDTPVSRVLVDDAVRVDRPANRTYVLGVYQDEAKLSKNERHCSLRSLAAS